MARYVSLPRELVTAPIVFGKKPCATYSQFGSGQFEYFGVSGTFVIPAGVTNLRVTAVGAGGAGGCSACRNCFTCEQISGPGGGGGGYVLAEVPVTPGCTCTITVGAFPNGTTCMGTQVVAFGGANACSPCRCTSDTGFCNFAYGALGCAGIGGGTSTSGVTALITACGSCGTLGCCWTSCSIYSCVSSCNECCLACTCNACASCFRYDDFVGRGGAAGSYLGTAVASPFPGTSCADLFACKAFNGENVATNDLSVSVIKARWPGEIILNTSRLETNISGTAAGYPANPPAYNAIAFGGAGSLPCCYDAPTRCFGRAGCGGGASGGNHAYYVRRCSASYDQSVCTPCGPGTTCSCGGNGYFVIEY